MSKITSHERPGVYSAYEASAVVSGRNAGGMVGLAALCSAGTPETVTMLYSAQEAAAAFGAGSGLARLTELLLLNGAAAVAASPAPDSQGYEAAFAALNEVEGCSILVCDTVDQAVQAKLKGAVEAASGQKRERIAVVSAESGETVPELTARAAALNSERMVLVAPAAAGEALPGAALAAAVAGAIAGERDPAVPLGGATLAGISGFSQSYSEEAIDGLIRGGVTVVERMGGATAVVRGITTRTTTGGASDDTWRELTTIRIVDNVIPAVRDALRARFARSKNTEQVRSAIRSQVIMELETKLAREIITNYGEVTVRALEDNPTVCLVEFSFTVAHGLNQIWLSAKITV